MITSTRRRKPSKHSRNNQLKAIMSPFDRQVKKLADELLVEEFVAVVLNGLETGSYEEALAEELVDRFQVEKGIQVEDEHSAACWAMPTCTVCGLTKKPIGRDAITSGYCDTDCQGYRRDPIPGHFWPNEKP